MDVTEGEVPTAAKLRKLRVVELRKRLQSLELPQSGNKEELIGRLRQYYLDQKAKLESESKEMEEEKGEEEMVVEEEKEGEGEGEKVTPESEGGGEAVGESGEKEEAGEKEEVDVKKEEEHGRVEDMQTEATEPANEQVSPDQPAEAVETQQSTTTGDVSSEPAAAAPDAVTTSDSGPSEEREEKEEEKVVVKNEGDEDGEKGVEEMVEETREPEATVSTTDSQSEQESTSSLAQAEEPVVKEESANIEPVQSVDHTVPNLDALPPPVTSDYYSDSAREEVAQPTVSDNPQIARDHLPMGQPAVAPVSAPPPPPPPPPPATDERKPPATVPDIRTPADQAADKKIDEPKGKKKKKRRRRRRHNQGVESVGGARETENEPPEVEIEYVQEDLLQPGDAHYKQFHKIFEAFKLSDDSEATPKTTPTSHIPDDDSMSIAAKSAAAQKKQREEESEDEEEPKEPAKLSKKKLRKLNRLTVAQLKQLVDRPDVVEMHDVTAQDPKLLIHLKSTRNTVPVPRHWCFKRKYLQGKRGIEKPPFNLPDFIKATGIMEMRQAVEEKEDAKSLKQKTRERVRPKMGKLTIDYQKLHDAFFRWQTKPKMTIHGDLYYEGKEFETRLREKKPGDLSDELRRALGMPTGMGKQKFPPPWLVAMQRYGPPPSYPNLKIPGLNAPIPEGCSFGYFVGGWGKPPVDEMGRPLYGDVFGLDNPDNIPKNNDEEIDKQLWGELESEEEMEEEDESGEDEGELKPEDLQAGLITPLEGGLVTPSGLTSIPAGLETPEMIQLRKKKIEEAMEQGGDTPALYTVLPEKAQSVGGAVMGSSHVYDISAAVPGANKKAGGGAGGEGVEVALDPSELDLDAATMTARYEEQMKETKLQKEDLSDMVAEHAAKQKKRKRAATDSGGGGGKASKKLKEFKF